MRLYLPIHGQPADIGCFIGLVGLVGRPAKSVPVFRFHCLWTVGCEKVKVLAYEAGIIPQGCRTRTRGLTRFNLLHPTLFEKLEHIMQSVDHSILADSNSIGRYRVQSADNLLRPIYLHICSADYRYRQIRENAQSFAL